ncbi:PREDICTED: putative uncharacterized protein C16orf96 homolog [Tinamus guttatus]|uniref:putative uncharacterized protein C16orf96 homolog n=1 Tax=Tinamus guttatus TaxID=94827 RepID=UPI00052E84C8|nr:PREDICTED: putative uncharacterized protein C16orf96 homolog [Tinamus guttatus]
MGPSVPLALGFLSLPQSSRAVLFQKAGVQEPGPEDVQEPARQALRRLSLLPEQHEAMGTRVTHLESQLRQRASVGTLDDIAAKLERVQDDIKHLEDEEEKALDFRKNVLEQVGQLREQCTRLQEAAERLWSDTEDVQSLREMVEHLDMRKADKALLEQGMDVKADKAELETKVSQEELQSAIAQLSEMMQDLLQKMSLQDQDWQKALEKLVSDMDSKLDHMVLNPLRVQLERVWRFTKKYLRQGPPFSANSAAGFKRQLFERVKCISCDRPLTMARRPQLVTVRKSNLLTRPRPASANGYEYLARRAQAREGEGSTMAAQGAGAAPQRWPGDACATSAAGQLFTSSCFSTVCPYGDPTAFTTENVSPRPACPRVSMRPRGLVLWKATELTGQAQPPGPSDATSSSSL